MATLIRLKKDNFFMIDSSFMSFSFTSYVILFFSVHVYMDIRMFRSKPLPKSDDELVVPFWAQALAFTPSLGFWILFIASPVVAYSGLYEKIGPVLMKSSYENHLQIAGLLLILAGILLADWGRVSRGVIAPSRGMPEGYALSTSGAYSIVRHPMYVSYTLFFVGIPLVFLNVFLFLLIAGIPGYYRIAKEEERILTKRFGEDYTRYQKRVGMFFPKLK